MMHIEPNGRNGDYRVKDGGGEIFVSGPKAAAMLFNAGKTVGQIADVLKVHADKVERLLDIATRPPGYVGG